MGVQVLDLLPTHEQAAARASFKAGLLAMLGQLLPNVQNGFSWAFIATRLDLHAHELGDQTLWFVGAAAAIDTQIRTAALDPHFVMVDRLHGLEARLISQQRAVMTRCAPLVMRGAVERYQERLGGMLEAVRDLRGAIQAFEADRCAGAPGHAEPAPGERI